MEARSKEKVTMESSERKGPNPSQTWKLTSTTRREQQKVSEGKISKFWQDTFAVGIDAKSQNDKKNTQPREYEKNRQQICASL